jgi:mannose-6-phosphate isomerase-like protein (cupin superfamily)
MSTPALATPTRTLQSFGSLIHIHATADDSAGGFSMIEMVLPPKFPGAPTHYHKRMTETFYVLQGALDATIDNGNRMIYPGECAVIKPGMRHSFRNSSSQTLRFLLIATPGGHDRFFSELIEWMDREPQWPPRDKKALIEFGLRHDTYYL